MRPVVVGDPLVDFRDRRCYSAYRRLWYEFPERKQFLWARYLFFVRARDYFSERGHTPDSILDVPPGILRTAMGMITTPVLRHLGPGALMTIQDRIVEETGTDPGLMERLFQLDPAEGGPELTTNPMGVLNMLRGMVPGVPEREGIMEVEPLRYGAWILRGDTGSYAVEDLGSGSWSLRSGGETYIVDSASGDVYRWFGDFRMAGRVDRSGTEADGSRTVDAWMLAYLLARILVSAHPDERMINWFSRGMAKYLVNDVLWPERGEVENDLLISIILDEMDVEHRLMAGEEEGETMAREIRENFGHRTRRTRGFTFCLDWVSYLRLGGQFVRSGKHKLVNRTLRGSMVDISRKEDMVRLLEEFTDASIGRGLPGPVSPEFLARYAGEIRMVEMLAEAAAGEEITATRGIDRLMPPCMAHIGMVMDGGVNATHVERVAYATYLVTMGLKAHDILDRFRGTPDFREDLALYQIEHLMGLRGSKRYDAPSCRWLAANGICRPDKICINGAVLHPVRYTREMKRLYDAAAAGISKMDPGDPREIRKSLASGTDPFSSGHLRRLNAEARSALMDRLVSSLGAYIEETQEGVTE